MKLFLSTDLPCRWIWILEENCLVSELVEGVVLWKPGDAVGVNSEH
jgi:hypothetical protein